MTPKARQTRRATSRFCLLLIPLLIGGIGWLWQRPARSAHDSHSVRVADPISPTGADGYFAADIAGPVTCLELSTGDSSDCDLIIGALGESETRFSVRLSGVQDASPRCSRWNKVTSLTWRTLEPRSRVEWPANARGMKELPVVQLSALSGIPVGDIRTQASRAFPPIGDSNDTAENTLQERSFFLHVTDTPLEDQRGYVSVRATLVGEGDQVRVYRDLQVTPGEIANGLVRELIELLDRQILPRSRVILGQHRDVDGDGKLAVLLTGWLERLQGGRTSVQGFVRSQDFDPSGVPPYSNRADVLYLNAGLRPGPELVPLLAHEYAHAVVCSLRLPGGLSATGLPVEADWLNEGYAHLAERMQQAGWSNLEHRITAFLDAPESAPLVVQDYYRTGRWRDAGCRGATFLFLDWCLQQSDESLLRALASDPLTGVAKLEEHSGIPFAELFRGWTIALHQGGWPALDLNSDLGRHTLAGPKIRTWNVAETECALELQGTSATFVRCQFESHRPRCQIRIEAPRNARLQVTAALRR